MGDLSIFLVVVGIAVSATATLLLVRASGASDNRATTPLDTGAVSRWLVDAAPRPVRGLLRSVDRRVAGGAMITAAFAVLFVAVASIGWIFSGIEDQRGFARWDAAAAEYGRDNATDASTQVLDLLTDLGASFVLFVLMALIGAYHSVRRSDTGPLVYLVVVGVGVALLNNGLKLMIDRDRPDLAQLAGSSGSSFPSGHTAAAAACWAAIALVLACRRSAVVRWAAATGAIFLAVVVAATRVLLGVHWVSDVAAGLLVGWGWWLLVTILFGGRTLRLGEPVRHAAADDRSGDVGRADDSHSRPFEQTGRS